MTGCLIHFGILLRQWMYKFIPSRLKMSSIIGYPTLGGVAIVFLLDLSGRLGEIKYLRQPFSDPSYEGRFQFAIYLLVTAVATATVFGVLTGRLFVWIYRQVPFPLSKWRAHVWEKLPFPK